MVDLYRNKLIAQLPGRLRSKIQTQSRVMILRTGQELLLPGQTTTYGAEGMLTLPARNDQTTNLVAMALSSGTALRIAQITLRQLAKEHDPLRLLLATYQDYTIQQLCQVIACYRHHSIKQQLSCWLLTHDDRYPETPILTTHAALAERLGVRREAISMAASHLQKAGALGYQRGQIKWIERSILLAHSCECYAALHAIEHKKAQQNMTAGLSESD